MNMTCISRKVSVLCLLIALTISGTALAQDKATEHDDHAAKSKEGSKMMMDGCDMMKMDMEKGGKMMGEGHAKMMEGMKGMKKMDGKQKMKMMAADKKMMVGKKMMPVPLLVLGDMLPHRNAVDADIPMALAWLETMARLNFLRRNETWSKMFERFVDDRGRDGVWHPHKGMATPKTPNPFVWPFFPLESISTSGDERWTDVTFRIGLIARLSGRTIELR